MDLFHDHFFRLLRLLWLFLRVFFLGTTNITCGLLNYSMTVNLGIALFTLLWSQIRPLIFDWLVNTSIRLSWISSNISLPIIGSFHSNVDFIKINCLFFRGSHLSSLIWLLSTLVPLKLNLIFLLFKTLLLKFVFLSRALSLGPTFRSFFFFTLLIQVLLFSIRNLFLILKRLSLLFFFWKHPVFLLNVNSPSHVNGYNKQKNSTNSNKCTCWGDNSYWVIQLPCHHSVICICGCLIVLLQLSIGVWKVRWGEF